MSKVMKQTISTASSGKQQGFTLIEIAIVLVIIGLLLGGVLKGQELINTARVRALNNNVDGITAAWFSFQDRYRGFPGDYSQAVVNIPDPTGTAGTIVANGDGNGLVDTVPEQANVWVQLQAAGYITGNFDADAAGTLAVDSYDCSLDTCPDNGFGSGMNLAFGLQVLAAGAATPPVAAHELMTGRGIPVEVLAELDRKVDDGATDSGAMQLGLGSTNGWSTLESGACNNGGNYQVQNPSGNCAAVFRNF
jgi:prepilin-type N-terminal cleavage/methylation domain-containing protein